MGDGGQEGKRSVGVTEYWSGGMRRGEMGAKRLPSSLFHLPTSIFHFPDFLSARFGWKAGWGFDRERRVWPCSVEIGAGRSGWFFDPPFRRRNTILQHGPFHA